MKKIFVCLVATAISAASFISCDTQTDIEAGGTAVEKMAGSWIVSMDAINADGSLFEAEYIDAGVNIYTYNTAANVSTEMWLDDLGELWSSYFPKYQGIDVEQQMKLVVDYKNLTFHTAEPIMGVSISNGKILLGKGHNLHGLPTDSIYFEFKLEGDQWAEDDGFDRYCITGVKEDGFYE